MAEDLKGSGLNAEHQRSVMQLEIRNAVKRDADLQHPRIVAAASLRSSSSARSRSCGGRVPPITRSCWRWASRLAIQPTCPELIDPLIM